MADIRVTSVIETYQRRLNSKPYVPSMTLARATQGTKGVANTLFLAFLFSKPDVGVQFLKDVGLIRSSMVCGKCGNRMPWWVDTNRKEGYRWRCRTITSPSACSVSTSIRHGSWFQESNLNLIDVLFLTSIDRLYEHDREHVAAREGFPHSLQPDRGITSFNPPTTWLCRDADPTTWTNAPSSCASLQIWIIIHGLSLSFQYWL
jgi:hypothetical protein